MNSKSEEKWESEIKKVYGWTFDEKAKKVSPPKFGFPDFVIERLDWICDQAESGLTFLGAVHLVLEPNEQDKEDFEVMACTDWLPMTDEFKNWLEEDRLLKTYRQQEIILALIYGY